MTFILTVLGVVLMIEGIPYFAFPARARQWALLMQELPDSTLRTMGFISMAMGLFLLFAAKYVLGGR